MKSNGNVAIFTACLLSASALILASTRAQQRTVKTRPKVAAATKVNSQRPELAWQNSDKWPINAVVFSPDGKTLVTGRSHSEIGTSAEHAVKLWDVKTGRLLRTFIAPGTGIYALEFSPDGTLLAGAGSGGMLLWNAANGEIIRKLRGHTDWVLDIAFAPDGKTLASGSVDNTLRLWDVATGILERTLTVPNPTKQRSLDAYSVHSVAFSPDGKTVAGAYFYEGALRLWNVRNGQLMQRLPKNSQEKIYGPQTIAFAPDGKTLAVGGGRTVFSDLPDKTEYGSVSFWNAQSGQKLRSFSRHHFAVKALAFAPDGKWLLSGGDEGTVRLQDVRSGEVRHILYGRAGRRGVVWNPEINSVAFSPQGNYLAAGDGRGLIKMWRLVD